jgi:DNA-binding MarR family transcriptional regulator
MSGRPPSDAERSALKAVVNLLRLSEPLIFELWRSHELTLAQVQCLRILSIQAEQAGDLAKKLSMSSTSLTRVLERLESRQLVDRIVDVHDRRRIWVQLTQAGQQTVSSLGSWYLTPLFRAIQAMPPDKLVELTEVLTQFNQMVRSWDSPESSTTDLSAGSKDLR